MISSDPRVPWPSRSSHPADSSTLPLYMVLFFVLGLIAFAAHGAGDGREALIIASIVSGVFFACFLILFAVYWIGYLLKEHAVWLAGRQAESGGAATDQQPEE
ncbi:hypothetical protein KBX53_19385 [Micromonospora sp. M51]|uniref:Uncharacterized protein n=1 Tax=Micromonospora parva TaxID=1464048 RepID=A0ABW6W118_9ACTN|nr:MULTISPECIES: hypothetical protein [Micromonospora]MBQ1013081.1 hypothetical protein [Micromonospora sp. M51]